MNLSFWHGLTNRKWLSIKIQYLLSYAGVASCQPFIVLFYTSLGLKVSQIGIIECLYILISLLSRPIFGTLADKSQRHYLVLGISITAFMIPFSGMAFVWGTERVPSIFDVTVLQNASTITIESCNQHLANIMQNHTNISVVPQQDLTSHENLCYLNCDLFDKPNISSIQIKKSDKITGNCSYYYLGTSALSYPVKSAYCTIECLFEEKKDSSVDWTFVIILFLRSLSAIAYGPAFTLIDAIAYEILGPAHRNLWGQQRMFGTLGWGISAIVMGVIIDQLHTFRYSFISLTVLTTASIFVAFLWLPKQLGLAKGLLNSGQSQFRLPFLKSLKTVLVSPLFCLNCVVAVVSGMLLGTSQVVLPQLLKSLGASKMLFGFTTALICIFEIPTLFFAGAVIEKFGEVVCFLLMLAAYAIRFFAYAFLTESTVWAALPIETLHIFCFGLYYPAATRAAAVMTQPETSSTVQAILSTSYQGIGKGAGIILASVVYDNYSGHIAFLMFSAFALASFGILLFLFFTYLRSAYESRRSSNASTVAVIRRESIMPIPDNDRI